MSIEKLALTPGFISRLTGRNVANLNKKITESSSKFKDINEKLRDKGSFKLFDNKKDLKRELSGTKKELSDLAKQRKKESFETFKTRAGTLGVGALGYGGYHMFKSKPKQPEQFSYASLIDSEIEKLASIKGILSGKNLSKAREDLKRFDMKSLRINKNIDKLTKKRNELKSKLESHKINDPKELKSKLFKSIKGQDFVPGREQGALRGKLKQYDETLESAIGTQNAAREEFIRKRDNALAKVIGAYGGIGIGTGIAGGKVKGYVDKKKKKELDDIKKKYGLNI